MLPTPAGEGERDRVDSITFRRSPIQTPGNARKAIEHEVTELVQRQSRKRTTEKREELAGIAKSGDVKSPAVAIEPSLASFTPFFSMLDARATAGGPSDLGSSSQGGALFAAGAVRPKQIPVEPVRWREPVRAERDALPGFGDIAYEVESKLESANS